MQSFQPANFVFGRGRIESRPVVVGGDDFTVRGGAADASIRGKQVQSEQMANELRIPLVRLIDGTGGGGSVKTIETEGYTYVPANPAWDWVVRNMGTVPVVALGLGSVAGLGAARLATSHYSVMVESISHMFIAGPPVVARLSGPITKDELGAADIHARAGAVDDVVDSEAEAFARARRFLSYLPSSVYELPERTIPADDPARRDPWLIEAVPHDRRKVYDMRRILNAIVDKDSQFEMGRKFGGSVITACAGSMDGRSRCWPAILTSTAAAGPRRFSEGDAVRRSREHVPSAIVHLVDVPGFVIGVEAEKAGTIRHGARALAAIYQARVPFCSIIIRKVFGVAARVTPAPQAALSLCLALGRLGFAAGRGRHRGGLPAELDAAPDRGKLRAEIEERLNRYRSPFRTAETFLIEEIIDPRDTRPLLCEFASLVAKLREPGPVATPMRP
jgi:acetyl-CoA carboxylase carboxyltransferase component